MDDWEKRQQHEKLEKAKRWIHASGRKDTYICSLHFMEPIEEIPDPIIATSIKKRKLKKRITPPSKKNRGMEEKSTFSREYNEPDLTGNDELNTISPEKNTKAVQTDFGPEKAIVCAQLESKILRHSILVNNCPSGQVTENINCMSFKVIYQNWEKFKYFVGLFPKQFDALFDFLVPAKEHLTYWDSKSATENVMRARTTIQKCSIQE